MIEYFSAGITNFASGFRKKKDPVQRMQRLARSTDEINPRGLRRSISPPPQHCQASLYSFHLNMKMNRTRRAKKVATLSIVRSMTMSWYLSAGMKRTNFSIRRRRNVRSTDRPPVPPCINSTRLQSTMHAVEQVASRPVKQFSFMRHFYYNVGRMRVKRTIRCTGIALLTTVLRFTGPQCTEFCSTPCRYHRSQKASIRFYRC